VKYIGIEGCIGVGKTTVATLLASSIKNASILLEDFGNHPFLSDFYSDTKYTFESEMGFLLIHYHQLFKLMGEQPEIIVSDYFFEKDRLFADANILSEKEMDIFMQLYDYLRGRLLYPDAIICLTGTTDLIYSRVVSRGREIERNISYDYINKINGHYETFFSGLRERFCTINVDMNENDFVKEPDRIGALLRELEKLGVLGTV